MASVSSGPRTPPRGSPRGLFSRDVSRLSRVNCFGGRGPFCPRSEDRALLQRPLRRIAARRPNYCRLGGGKLGFCPYFRCHSSSSSTGGISTTLAMRLLGLDLGGRQIRHALAQQDFNGADLADGQFALEQAQGMILQPIDKLTRSDFFPDIIGMKEHL